MPRCVRSRRDALLALCAAALPWPAPAQVQRNFPATALRGELVFTNPPEVLLEGRPARLAPGARIRGENNLLLVLAALAGQRRVVHYTFDLSGALLDIWVLTAAERAKRPWPSTPAQAAAWSFDAVAQTWSRP